MNCFPAGEFDRWFITVKSRIEHDHFITTANQTVNRDKERLCRPGGDGDLFVEEFNRIIDRFGFNGFIEESKGGYEEYMVSKLRNSNYWVELWES